MIDPKEFIQKQNELETLVDKYGITAVCQMLANICSLKAEHVRENWSPGGALLSAQWQNVATKLDDIIDETEGM